ncbi:MAG: hypothetical protein U9Q77_08645 [Candidatus Marinimicrobia bacterium]|nr:hypothetical protein [Candidatus Neomarinimicrobiota bacterium]
MKIDLRKDTGILGSRKFLNSISGEQELSGDEQIIETLRKRHAHDDDEPDHEKDPKEASPSKEGTETSKGNLWQLVVVLIIVLFLGGTYLNTKDLLAPRVDIVKGYWMEKFGFYPEAEVDSEYIYFDTLYVNDILSDELFDELMPVTEDIAALADSIATLPPESLVLDYKPENDTMETEPYLQVSETPIHLSDDDIKIINNRSLLLMLTEMIGVFPEDIGQAHLFLKRDALRMTAPRSDSWVPKMQSTMDKFVLGSFDESYGNGNIKISSKYEIIMNAEQDFEAQLLDEMRLLDVLAHPFNDYLEQIIIDLSQGVEDNPAKFIFSGTTQEMQYVLSSWSETRSNYLLRSVDINFENKKLRLTFDVLFFKYNP